MEKTDAKLEMTPKEIARLALLTIDWSDQWIIGSPGPALAAQAIRLKRACGPGSMLEKVLFSDVILGRLVSVDLEESSRRYVVEYVARNGRTGDDGERAREILRTPRIDGRDGDFYESLGKRLANSVGRDVLLYKYLEPGRDGKSYRTLSWAEIK